MQTYHPKNIKVGIIEFVFCGTDKKPMWAIHGGRYETRERIVRELARAANNELSKNKIERHI